MKLQSESPLGDTPCSMSSCSRKSSIRILLLQLVKNVIPDCLNALRCNSTGREVRKRDVEKAFEHANAPLAHDERFWDIDSSDGNGHNLRLVSGWSCRVTIKNWPCLKISFPEKVGCKVNNKPKHKAADYGQYEIVHSEKPSRLELGPPCDILASGTLDDLAKCNVGDIKRTSTLWTVQIIPDSLVDADGRAVSKFRIFWRWVHSSLISSSNARGMARELAAQESESTTDING